MNTARIGFLGAGNMSGALIAGLIAGKTLGKGQIGASDPRADQLAELAARHGIQTFGTNAELVKWATVLVLGVKPQVVPAVLAECGTLAGPEHLVVSICAGIPIATLESGLGKGCRVVRAMPNTAALALAAATAVSAGTRATPEDLQAAQSLFDAVGRTVVLPEHHLDAVTGLSGSGPGFVMLFVEALADGGVKMGLPRDVALLLASQTVFGSAKLLLDTREHPARLKDMVTSPGGTTIAGLKALETGAVRASVMEAVEQATLRSAELGQRRG
jgi:pyrroline-5-carboxylate reductase